MKQWIIDRYNKGQDKYKSIVLSDPEDAYIVPTKNPSSYNEKFLSLYDFLFNPKWGFAKAFWGIEKVCQECGGKVHNGYDVDCDNGCYRAGLRCTDEKWKCHLQQMAISDDVLKYLEQFK